MKMSEPAIGMWRISARKLLQEPAWRCSSSFIASEYLFSGKLSFSAVEPEQLFFFPCQLPDSHGRKKGVMFSFQHPSPSSLLLWKMKQASYFCYSSFPSASFLQDLSLSWIIPVPILVPSSSFFKLHLRGCWVFPAQHGALLEHRLGSW